MNKAEFLALIGKTPKEHECSSRWNSLLGQLTQLREPRIDEALLPEATDEQRVRALALIAAYAIDKAQLRDAGDVPVEELESVESSSPMSFELRARVLAGLRVLAQAPSGHLLAPLAAIVGAISATFPKIATALLEQLDSFLAAASTATGTTAPPTNGSGSLPSSSDDDNSNSGSDNEEDTMAIEPAIDIRGLPPRFIKQDGTLNEAVARAFVGDERTGTIAKLMVANGGSKPTSEVLAYVVGKLLRNGQADERTGSFADFVARAWSDMTKEYPIRGGRMAGHLIVKAIVTWLGGKSNGVEIPKKAFTAQQLAFIFEKAAPQLVGIAPNDSSFGTLVDRYYLEYVASEFGAGTGLPSLDGGTGGAEGDLIPQNMTTAARLYGAYQFERLRLIPVIDRVVELWRAGVIPIANDSGGQLLNDYYWSREDRLTEGGRSAIFGRLFGAPNTESSKDAQPNTTFDTLLRRFFTNVALLKRLEEQQIVLAQPGESRTLASENARKTGRELAANLSLYGWGSAYYDASRIEDQLGLAAQIGNDPAVLRSFSATTISQLIERVCQQEWGFTPPIVKHETMGRSVSEAIKILANNPSALTRSDLEFQNALDTGDDLQGRPNWNALARHALAWLSVNGTTSEQLVQQATPVDLLASPTIPQMPGQSAGPNVNQLRDMVAAGKVPSLAELKQMFN